MLGGHTLKRPVLVSDETSGTGGVGIRPLSCAEKKSSASLLEAARASCKSSVAQGLCAWLSAKVSVCA